MQKKRSHCILNSKVNGSCCLIIKIRNSGCFRHKLKTSECDPFDHLIILPKYIWIKSITNLNPFDCLDFKSTISPYRTQLNYFRERLPIYLPPHTYVSVLKMWVSSLRYKSTFNWPPQPRRTVCCYHLKRNGWYIRFYREEGFIFWVYLEARSPAKYNVS